MFASKKQVNQLVWVSVTLFFLSKHRNHGGGRGKIALEMLLSCM